MLNRLRDYHIGLWHRPIRAETYALLRILFAAFLLLEQLLIYLPNLGFFYGPNGVAPEGVNDDWLRSVWQWPVLLFSTDHMGWVTMLFSVWVASTIAMLVGWKTKWASILVWLGTTLFLVRNPNLRNGGDDVLRLCLFYLMFMPLGHVLSLDQRAQTRTTGHSSPGTVPPWGIRFLQWQLAFIYLSTGLAKLQGDMWWDGSALHYVLNDTELARFSFVYTTLPYEVTQLMSWASVTWEILFLPLVWYQRTRKWMLYMGILFHLGILVSLEVGWFSLYTTAIYVAFIPDSWWAKLARTPPRWFPKGLHILPDVGDEGL